MLDLVRGRDGAVQLLSDGHLGLTLALLNLPEWSYDQEFADGAREFEEILDGSDLLCRLSAG